MTIEPSDNNPLTIGTLIHENMALRSTLETLTKEHGDLQKRHVQQFEGYERHIKVQQNLILRAQEECKRAQDDRDDIITQLAAAIRERDAARARLEPLQTHLKKRIKELIEAHNAKHRAEARCAELERLHSAAVAQSVSFANDLIAERTAHNKLKALCNERGFGTPLFYTPPTRPNLSCLIDWSVEFHTKHQGTIKMHFGFGVTSAYLDSLMDKLGAVRWDAIPPDERAKLKPEPRWSVEFFNNEIPLGVITYSYAPLTSILNMLQESLKATSWKMTYSHT